MSVLKSFIRYVLRKLPEPDAAELELADFIRRTEEALDEPGQVQLEAALRYLRGREEAVRLDVRSINFYSAKLGVNK